MPWLRIDWSASLLARLPEKTVIRHDSLKMRLLPRGCSPGPVEAGPNKPVNDFVVTAQTLCLRNHPAMAAEDLVSAFTASLRPKMALSCVRQGANNATARNKRLGGAPPATTSDYNQQQLLMQHMRTTTTSTLSKDRHSPPRPAVPHSPERKAKTDGCAPQH